MSEEHPPATNLDTLTTMGSGLREIFCEGYGHQEGTIEFGGAQIFFHRSEHEEEQRYTADAGPPMVSLYFSLQGTSGMRHKGCKETFLIKDNQHVMSYIPYFEGEYFIKSPRINNFGILLGKPFFQRLMATDLECLKRFWDDVQNEKGISILPGPMPVMPQQKAVINDILNCTYVGDLRRLYYESKIVELFLLQAQQAEGLLGQRPTSFKSGDIERLHAAKAYVESHLFEPLTLEQIARACLLNDFKLKKGFKELFGNTVFGYISEMRMQHARKLLTDTSATVYEVADVLGYSEPHNFSKAFKKHFGYLPGTLRK